jgi:adenine deaminase
MIDTATLRRRVRVARGEEQGDLLLSGGRVINVFTGAIEEGDVVIADGVIAGAGAYDWRAAETIDVGGCVISPGLIDAHMHIESTLLMPAELSRLVVPHGTSAVIADPHEIGNVLGIPGIELMLDASAGLPLDCFFMAPSCVPASPFENAGATLDAEAIADLLRRDRVLGLAEMMNFPGVIGADEGVLAKIAAALEAGAAVDGHSPGLLGRDLLAYATAGIQSDHECTTPEEAIERAALGMLVQVREGSMARNLDTFLPLILDGRLGRWCLCTDDIHPQDLVNDGHIDHLLRRLVAAGVEAALAVRHASLVPAEHYGLRGRGAVAGGYRADLVVFEDVRDFRPRMVIKGGTVASRQGEYLFRGQPPRFAAENTIHLGPLSESSFQLAIEAQPVPVIGVVPDQIVTRREDRQVRVEGGKWAFDPADDVALIACIQRHEPTGRLGVGLVSGFSFSRHGALGSSVGHDAHNLIITGTNGRDMLACAEALQAMGGGFVVVADGQATGRMPLPVAGLMSTDPVAEVCAQQRAVDQAAAALGCLLHSPFGTLSFLALSVIPSLRITDAGLFDVERFELVR